MAIVLVVIAAVWWSYPLQKERSRKVQTIEPSKTLKPQNPVSIKKDISAKTPQNLPPSSKRKIKRCFSVQLAYDKPSSKRWLEAYRKKVQKMGFICHIRQENGNLALLCDTKRKRRDLAPSIERAKSKGLDYQIRRDECRYVTKPKRVEKQSSHRIPEKRETSSEAKKLLQSESFDPVKVEKLFEKRKSYDLALELARYYLRNKEYKKALLWAKRANTLDKESEEAWILYARSLYRLGKREKAKRVLRIYLEYKESKKIEELLKRWR